MGGIGSSLRRDMAVEELEMGNPQQQILYGYPPKNGDCYFGSFFWIGGERFDMSQPESYLFGDNSDVNFLTGRAGPFLYPAPRVREPTRTLQSLVNLRKDSLHLVRSQNDADDYQVEFAFDADAPVSVTLHYQAVEIVTDTGVKYNSKSQMQSAVFHYPAGFGQVFSHPEHTICPSTWPETQLTLPAEGPPRIYPVVVHMEVEGIDSANSKSHSHSTIAVLEKSSDNTFTMKVIKQKQVVDGVLFLLQDIYGVASKADEQQEGDDEDSDDETTGLECELCLTEIRDTLILPCRHLCLCSTCAETLRYSASTCPFCRQPFHALLHVGAVRERTPVSPSQGNRPNLRDEAGGTTDVHLLEVINSSRSRTPSVATTPEHKKVEDEQNAEIENLAVADESPATVQTQTGSLNSIASRRELDHVQIRPTTDCSMMSDSSSHAMALSSPSLPGMVQEDCNTLTVVKGSRSSTETDLESDEDGSKVALLGSSNESESSAHVNI